MTASSVVGGGKDIGEVDIVHIAGELIWVDETCLNEGELMVVENKLSDDEEHALVELELVIVVGLEESEDL